MAVTDDTQATELESPLDDESLASGREFFGLPATPYEEDERFAEPEPEVGQAPETPLPEAESQKEEEAVEETQAKTEEKETLYAGKYKTVEALEQGYQNLRDLQRRTAESSRAIEEEARAYQERAMFLQQQLVPLLQPRPPVVQQPAPAQQQEREWYEEPQQPQPQRGPEYTPEQLQAIINAQVQSQAWQLQQDFEARENARQALEDAQEAITEFYESHPEVEPDGPVDQDLMRTLVELNQSWGQRGENPVNLGDVDALNIVYEASKDPQLAWVLANNPTYFDSDNGVQLARVQAAQMRGESITQTSQTVPASAVGQRKPVLESASTSGGNQPRSDPDDPWEGAVQAYNKSKAKTPGADFFFGQE